MATKRQVYAFHQVFITPGGLIHLRDGANTQYVTSTAFLFVA
jgi:endoglucanase